MAPSPARPTIAPVNNSQTSTQQSCGSPSSNMAGAVRVAKLSYSVAPRRQTGGASSSAGLRDWWVDVWLLFTGAMVEQLRNGAMFTVCIVCLLD